MEESVMAKKDEKRQEQLPEQPEEKVDNKKPVSEVITSLLFIQDLKKQLKDKEVSEAVYTAFIKVVPKQATKEAYQKIWKETFKRQ